MPVRSLHSPVLKWPDLKTVDQAARQWAGRLGPRRDDVISIGYFGSYARGDWGVGSDLDLVMVVADTPLPFERRATAWDTTDLPVPADVLIYTKREWEALSPKSRMADALRGTVWVYTKARPDAQQSGA